jgi:hypothetical protein
MYFDYSLHYRHVLASKEKCGECHHFYDKNLKELIWEKGTEQNCRDCHGAKDKGRELSLRNAVHQSCVGCHVKKQEQGQKTGPQKCVGCHDRKRRLAVKTFEYPRLKLVYSPRVKRRQPDRVWLTAKGAKTNVVAFDHKAHEPRVTFCSTCHHQTLDACSSCHTLTGTKKGGFVTLEKAYHSASSEHSCVGCHNLVTQQKDCAGCHQTQAASPSKRSCSICHNGPKAPKGKAKITQPFPGLAKLAPLPAYGDDFPNKYKIDVLAKEYKPSILPHGKIVTALDRAIGKSRLARQFHGRTEVTCAGCHHRSPLGKRPSTCRSCHAPRGHATRDKPGLRAAYHRQCMGCHQRMGLTKKLGCTDCHAKAGEGKK